MAIISLGQIDKKLLFIILIIIARTANLIITNEVPDEYSIDIFCSLEEEIGPIIIGLILYFIFKDKMDQKDENRKHFKYIIFLFILRGIKSSYERLYGYFIKEAKYKWNNLLNTINGVEIILMTFGTYLLLKYKYHIHQYISMILFCILGITSDFIIGSYFIMNYKYIYIYIVYILNEVLIYCYLKYMMDKLYYQYTEVVVYWGITGLLVKIIIFSSLSIHEYKNDIDGYLNSIYNYFTETNIFIIIFYQFFYFLFYGGLYMLLITLMLYYLRPNHMIVTDEIHVFEGLIFYKDKPNKYYTLIPFVLQIIALFFYFEILEFNFCNLNQNTAKNIQERVGSEFEVRRSTNSLIELEEQYYVKEYEGRGSDEGNNTSKDNIKLKC